MQAEQPSSKTVEKRAIPLDTLWLARLVARCASTRRKLQSAEHIDRDLARALGQDRLWDKPLKLLEATKRRLDALEHSPVEPEGLVSRNAARLARLFGLDPLEREIVTVLAYANDEGVLSTALNELVGRSTADLVDALATILGRPRADVGRALDPRATLRASRIVHQRHCERREGRLRLVSGLARALMREHARADALVDVFVRRSRAPRLQRTDFEHVSDVVDVLDAVLRAALRRRTRGVNVLLYGPPGTGKTQLVRVVASQLSAPLYEVQDEDADGDPDSGRLNNCAFAQRLLARSRRALLLFDEVEDSFPRRELAFFGTERNSLADKSWTHRLLENNVVPTIWLANEVEHIDRASLRRFDLVFEMPRPPRQARRRLLERRLGHLAVPAVWLDRVASDDRLTPGDVDRTARVARLLPKAGLDARLERLLQASLALQGGARPVGAGGPLVTRYDLAFVNASQNLDRLATALAKTPRASLCLHGPPGTGKTAYALHLAERLERPIRVERASDLLSMWVGATEKAIAGAFKKARDERAILLLDEADSLLRNRQEARASWEVTQVNELLVQLEAFDGIVLCATNLIDSLDPASLRRFSFKVRFDPMTAVQRWAMFFELAAGADVSEVRPLLDRWDDLTPGDFAAVARRLRVLDGEVRADALLSGLADERARKPGAAARVTGFARDVVDRQALP